ncbi:MAG TPA: mechanosensitive ion channel domain-containing protein [Candidatus Polarisedimenticolaceae bacterium]|nr:mechanosensitive ion channel domain-containing protein [Candidatus Polarisedimenticolaceae bacterium]
MNRRYRILSVALVGVLVATIAGLVLTSRPIEAPRSQSAYRNQPFDKLIKTAQDQFDTARQLAARAVSPEEQWTAREVIRIADSEVDLAFASALREANTHPPALSAEAQEIAKRLKSAEAQLDASQAEIARLKKAIEAHKASSTDALEQQLQLAEAQADLDQDDVDDAHHDLTRAGGDPQGIIQRMKDRYEAREQQSGGLQTLVPTGVQSSVETGASQNVVALARAWYSLYGKGVELRNAEAAPRARAAELTASHEKSEAPTSEAPSPAADQKMSSLKKRAADRKSSIVVDNRIENETQLADTYKRWSAVVQEKQRIAVHGLLFCLLWILIIGMVTAAADLRVRTWAAARAEDRKQAQAFHSVAGYAIRAVGALVILLVVFGPPTQFAAVLALAGAGLTVALKDFIIAFIGWFVLMGRNGIRAGDWVEINGVSGEVLEVGPMRTVLLETGNWSDAGHPTGRKIAFMNGFAVEGTYFNFSTSGQWMWDEIQLTLPADADPFVVADKVKEIVAGATRKNADQAADEWRRVAPTAAPESFRAEPVTSVRPTGSGVSLAVRYITRANERYTLRSTIYRALIDVQRGKRPSSEPPVA